MDLELLIKHCREIKNAYYNCPVKETARFSKKIGEFLTCAERVYIYTWITERCGFVQLQQQSDLSLSNLFLYMFEQFILYIAANNELFWR